MIRIVVQIQRRRQRGQLLEHPGGKRGQRVDLQIQIRQRGIVVEHPGGKRGQRVGLQRQLPQRASDCRTPRRPGLSDWSAPRNRSHSCVPLPSSVTGNRSVIGQGIRGGREGRPGIALQPQVRQRGQHPGGKPGQRHCSDSASSARSARRGGKPGQRVEAQTQVRQRGQLVEHPGGKRGPESWRTDPAVSAVSSSNTSSGSVSREL